MYFHTHFTVEKPRSRLPRKPTRGHALDKIWVQIPKQPLCLVDAHLFIVFGMLCGYHVTVVFSGPIIVLMSNK